MKYFLYSIGLVIFGGICFYAGVLVTSFSYNLCYSEAIGNISAQAEIVIGSNDPVVREEFEKMLKNLPLRGYETNCDEILSATQANAIQAITQ